MTKVIKGEFEKLEYLKIKEVLLTYNTSLKVFNDEFNRLSGIDDDLFTYKVKVANILCDSNMDDDSEHDADDDMGYDPSDVAFTEWLGSRIFNYKTMDHYTMKALWIYWIRGNDEVELTDEESSDNEDEVAEVLRIDANIFDYEAPLCLAFNEFNYLLKVDLDLLTKDIMSGLKEEALRNKTIMEGLIEEDDDDESQELCEILKLPVYNIRRFEMIRYSFGQDEEYVAIKENEYDDLARTSEDACRAYQEIFRMMDEGWMVTKAE
ncbi:hypothetical protein Tco_0927123 [Tanacetum coccineum]|uniref:Uncharacterized protein n=1 Tax=Tanacetum coccineum TaxID=301880 RepID=A0ABQ5DHY9_9ASTR